MVQNYEYCANPALVHDRNCSTLSVKEVAGGTGNRLADTQSNDLMVFSSKNGTCPGCGWVNFHSKVHKDLCFLFDAGWGGGRTDHSGTSNNCGATVKLDTAKYLYPNTTMEVAGIQLACCTRAVASSRCPWLAWYWYLDRRDGCRCQCRRRQRAV